MLILRRTYTVNFWTAEGFDFALSALLEPKSKFEAYHISIGGGFDLSPGHALYSIIIVRKDRKEFTEDDTMELANMEVTARNDYETKEHSNGTGSE